LFSDEPGRVVSTAGLPENVDHVLRDDEIVWYGTGAALRAQRAAARRAGLRWVALFSLGREPAGFWNPGAAARTSRCAPSAVLPLWLCRSSARTLPRRALWSGGTARGPLALRRQ
jgi:hypothetical protein